MESWLMEVDRIGRHNGILCYIQGLTRNHENDWNTINLAWMLYWVYAVLGESCPRCMLYSDYAVLGVYSTWCQLMIMMWRYREGWTNFVFCDDGRVVDEEERDGGWKWVRCGGYEWIWDIKATTCVIGLWRPRMSQITRQIRAHTCHIGDGKLTCTQHSLKSQFLIIISPISFHLSIACPPLYHYLKTRR
jgi:hypothetical protein